MKKDDVIKKINELDKKEEFAVKIVLENKKEFNILIKDIYYTNDYTFKFIQESDNSNDNVIRKTNIDFKDSCLKIKRIGETKKEVSERLPLDFNEAIIYIDYKSI